MSIIVHIVLGLNKYNREHGTTLAIQSYLKKDLYQLPGKRLLMLMLCLSMKRIKNRTAIIGNLCLQVETFKLGAIKVVDVVSLVW